MWFGAAVSVATAVVAAVPLRTRRQQVTVQSPSVRQRTRTRVFSERIVTEELTESHNDELSDVIKPVEKTHILTGQ